MRPLSVTFFFAINDACRPLFECTLSDPPFMLSSDAPLPLIYEMLIH